MTDECERQFGHAAVREDPWALRNRRRAWEEWHRPLHKAGWGLPFFLVADLGSLLIRPEVRIASEGLPADYLAVLRKILGDPRFQECSAIVLAAGSRRQDEAIRTAVQGMTKLVRGTIDESLPIGQQQEEVARRMPEGLIHRELGHCVGPVDLIAIRSAARLRHGPKLLDYRLLDECLGEWHRLPEHALRMRRAPVRRQGEKEVSRRAGEIVGYTGVRPRLPTDDWIDILQSEWSLLRKGQRPKHDSDRTQDRDRMVGLDKILNRQTMVYAKESPQDLIPQLQVLVVFLIDAEASIHLGGGGPDPSSAREAPWEECSRVKALAYRMILDAAEQVPYGDMAVHVAVYETSAGTHRKRSATCFDLRGMSLSAEPARQVVRFDEVIPYYFCYSHLRTAPVIHLPGPWPELSEDPFIFLGSASALASTYTAVLAVVFSQPRRWAGVFRSGNVPLRPVEIGRPAVMLVEADLATSERMYRHCRFASLGEAAVARAQFRSGGDLDVRNGFLDMLLGPARVEGRATVRKSIDVS